MTMTSRTGRGAASAAVLLALLLAAGPASAQSGRRVALVIGNSAYTHTSVLDNPANDAADVSAALRRLGFEVDRRTDLDRDAMHRALGEFGCRSARAEMSLVFYAGHGIEVNRRWTRRCGETRTCTRRWSWTRSCGRRRARRCGS